MRSSGSSSLPGAGFAEQPGAPNSPRDAPTMNPKDDDDHKNFGVFKPTGHTVISFPAAEQAQQARQAIAELGLDRDAVRSMTDTEMLAQIGDDLKRASPLAAVGQEMNLVLAHRALAERGYHWLVVRTDDDDVARRVADAARAAGAERAQRYGRFVIEEMIEHPDDEPQVAESPDRGLDAQTASGLEAERAQRRPPPDQP